MANEPGGMFSRLRAKRRSTSRCRPREKNISPEIAWASMTKMLESAWVVGSMVDAKEYPACRPTIWPKTPKASAKKLTTNPTVIPRAASETSQPASKPIPGATATTGQSGNKAIVKESARMVRTDSQRVEKPGDEENMRAPDIRGRTSRKA